MTYRAAVFDLDGTLLDSYVGIHDALSAVLEHFDRPPVTLIIEVTGMERDNLILAAQTGDPAAITRLLAVCKADARRYAYGSSS